ncbi:MAG: PKD domain-containing protein [Paludibacteraceae bacterium]
MKPFTTFLLLCVGMTAVAQSPYIERVYEYCPAPGQFVNLLPAYTAGDDATAMAQKATDCIAGTDNGTILSLGAWGGYIIFGFDHAIPNNAGADFKITGNAFVGNAEPGIVMVASDNNRNGLPDDPWYEIQGSAHTHDDTQQQYAVTYRKHNQSNDSIEWQDNRGNRGFIVKNSFRTQNYFPEWITDDSLIFVGTRLPDNAIEQSPNYFVLNAFDYGYADNQPNNADTGIDIDWAIDTAGQAVHLSSIDFVKVYTGVFQHNGNIGECSTEIAGAIDLHCNTATPRIPTDDIRVTICNGNVSIVTHQPTDMVVYNIAGQTVMRRTQCTECHLQLPTGIYIVTAGRTCRKIVL